MNVDRLISETYEAPLTPQGWESLLASLTTELDLVGGTLVLGDPRKERFRVDSYYGLDPVGVAAYNASGGARDLMLQATRRFPAGRFLSSGDFVERSEWERSEHFNLIMRPFGYYHLMGQAVLQTRDTHAVIGLVSSSRDRNLDFERRRELRALNPHLACAVGIRHRLGKLKSRSRGLGATFEALSTAVAFLDRRGRLVELNDWARTLLAEGDWLVERNGTLAARGRRANHRLRRAIRDALGGRGGGAVQLPGRGDASSLQVLVTPLAPSLSDELPVPSHSDRIARVALFLGDPGSTASLDAGLLCQLWGLTESEAHVCELLVRGLGPGAISHRRGTTVETVRSQLKSIYAKTGASSQADLVRRVLQSPLGHL